MMILCSMASELSNNDSCLRINTVVIFLGDVIRGNPWVVQAEMKGYKVRKRFVGARRMRSSRIVHRTSVYGG